MPFEDMLLYGIRDGERSKVPEVLFWSNLIAELGKQSPTPYDIFDEGMDHSRIMLDPVQRQLIMMRLAGDIALAEHARMARTGRSYRDIYQTASFRAASPALYDGPCELGNMQGVIADNEALAATTAFGKIATIVDSWVGAITGSSVVANYLRRAGLANILLNLLKFVATYAALEIKLEMSGDTIVRTKTRAPGERKQLTANVNLNTGVWSQLATCARPFLNAVGLDFSLPNNGAVSNAKVTFVLQEDEKMGGAEAIFHNGNAGNFFGDGNTVYSEPIGNVRIEPLTRQQTFTDSNGVAKINLVAEPQSQDLSHQKLTSVQNRMGVAAFIQLKPTDIDNLAGDPSRWAGSIMDYLGPLASFISGDEIGAALGAATETLYRASWYSSDVFPFTVKDWKSCGECWAGTFSMTSTYTDKFNKTEGEIAISHELVRTSMITFTVTIDAAGNVKTMATVDTKENGNDTKKGIDICHTFINLTKVQAPWSTSVTKVDTTAGTVPASVFISVDGSKVRIDGETDPVSRTITGETTETNGCYTDRKNGATPFNFNLTEKQYVHINAAGVPSRPNTAHGTQTIDSGTGKITYKWELERQ